jgi:hypothetical protein
MLARQVRAALADREVGSVDDLVRSLRLVTSPAEQRLLRRAGAVLGAAVQDAVRGVRSREARCAAVELAARSAGFVDVITSCDPAPDGTVSIDATGQYRHLWIRAARASGPGATLAEGTRAVGAGLRPGTHPGEIVRESANGVVPRLVAHADLGTDGAHRPRGSDAAALRSGQAVAVLAELRHAGGRVAVCDTYLVGDDRAESLTLGGTA